jgi:hypothetical protein
MANIKRYEVGLMLRTIIKALIKENRGEDSKEKDVRKWSERVRFAFYGLRTFHYFSQSFNNYHLVLDLLQSVSLLTSNKTR